MKSRVSIDEIVNSNKEALRVYRKETINLEELLKLYKKFIKDVMLLGCCEDVNFYKKRCNFWEDKLKNYELGKYRNRTYRFDNDTFVFEFDDVISDNVNIYITHYKRLYKGLNRFRDREMTQLCRESFFLDFAEDYFENYKDGERIYESYSDGRKIYQNVPPSHDTHVYTPSLGGAANSEGLVYFAILYYQNLQKYKEALFRNTLKVGYYDRTKNLQKIYPIALENGDYLFIDADPEAVRTGSKNWYKMSLFHFDENGKISLIPFDKVGLLDKSKLKTMKIASSSIPSFVKAGFINDIEELNSTLASYEKELSNLNDLELRLYKYLETKEPQELVEQNEEPECVNVINGKIRDIKRTINPDVNEKYFLDKLSKILDNYNRLINEYENNINDTLTFGVKDIDTIVFETITALDALKDEISNYNSSTVVYNNMLEYLDKVSRSIRVRDYYIDDEFLKLLGDLSQVSIPFIGSNNDIKERLTEILYTNPKSSIESYLKSITSDKKLDNLPYSSIEELVIYLRGKLQPILKEVSDLVFKTSIRDEIKKEMELAMDLNYQKANHRVISLYVEFLNDTYKRCLDIVPESETVTIHEIHDIMSSPIDYSVSIDDILKQINDKYYKLIKIYNRTSINDKREEIKELKRMHIELDAV